MKILLCDGSNLLWRAAHSRANADLTKKDGTPTGAVISFVHGILGHLERHKADCFAIIFDGPGASFRKHLLPSYKASREHAMEDSVKKQIPLMREAVVCLGGNLIDSKEFEADDVIASYVYAHKKNDEIVIISDDKDLGSLVDKNVVQVRPCDAKNGKPSPILDRDAIFKKWKTEPYLISDILALCGDGIDEVVGVKGVGPVHATKVLLQYGSLEDYALNAHKEDGSRWKQRASAMTNICLMAASTRLIKDISVAKLKSRSFDWPQKTIGFLKGLEADSAIKRIYKITGQRQTKKASVRAGRSLF